MTKEELIHSFDKLGSALRDLESEVSDDLFLSAANENPWFSPENVKNAIAGISKWLSTEIMSKWMDAYSALPVIKSKRIGLVLAGNIPLVGFHDVLCVLMSGHLAVTKLSSKDSVLMNFVRNELIKIDKNFADRWILTEFLKDIDAIIATGSDNSARYFYQYFSKYPHVIRKNRTSVAVLNGFESELDLLALGKDVFSYYGLGCRNVTHLFLHESVDPTKILDAFEHYSEIINHHKYANNYDYNRSIFLVNGDKHLASNFLLLKEDDRLFCPPASLFYSYYSDLSELTKTIEAKEKQIQCIVGNSKLPMPLVAFGKTQEPEIYEYADGVDTMKYLSTI